MEFLEFSLTPRYTAEEINITVPWIASGMTTFLLDIDQPKPITTKYWIPIMNLENIRVSVIVRRDLAVVALGLKGSHVVETDEKTAMTAK